MMRLQVLTTDQPAEWMSWLKQAAAHDFYHLPEYHALAEEQGEGQARLLAYTEGPYTIALPLLLRSLESVPGIEDQALSAKDATSVYGYAGPVASHDVMPDEVVRHFQTALRGQLQEWGIVAVFSRLHPLLPQQGLLAGLGEHKALAQTVSIDLTLAPDVQRAQYRKNHKEGINRLRRAGLTTVHDQSWSCLNEFIEIYNETMHRVGAAESYFFPRTYYERLCSRLAGRVQLFVSQLEGRAIGAGLFLACEGILQYHLGGTLTDYLKMAPMKLLMDDVRLWANEQRLRVFHLGGGTNSRPDNSLLHFKRGFSNRSHDFRVWRWVLAPEVYQRLCLDKSRWNASRRMTAAVPDYFPSYRCPTVLAV